MYFLLPATSGMKLIPCYSKGGESGIFWGFLGVYKKVAGGGWRLKTPSEWRRCSKNDGENLKSLSQLETFQIFSPKKYFL